MLANSRAAPAPTLSSSSDQSRTTWPTLTGAPRRLSGEAYRGTPGGGMLTQLCRAYRSQAVSSVKASTNAGMIRYLARSLSWLQNPDPASLLMMPPGGNQCRFTENRTIDSSANQNAGNALP